jgi:exonuclease III
MTPQTLRIYSLNVNGLNVDKALALHVELERLHIDIVLLQETHLLTDDHRIRQIERSLHPWQCYWGSALSQTTNKARPRQGVAILVRRRLLEQSYLLGFCPVAPLEKLVD